MNRKLKGLFTNKKLLFLSTINIMLVLIVLYFFCPLYEENDDFGISCIASGLYGTEYMQYLIYSNIIYGYFLKVFGLIFSGGNWYVIMQYLLLTVSVIAIFYCFSFRFPFHIVVCANMLFWYMGFLQQIRRIQFTRTASVLCIAGFVLIWHGVSLSKRIANILGIVLIVFGSSIRLDCFFPFSLFYCFIFLFMFFKGRCSKADFPKIFESIVYIIMRDRIIYSCEPYMLFSK